MTRLLRSPSGVASWDWVVEERFTDHIGFGVRCTVTVARILEEFDLLKLSEVCVRWHRDGQGSVGLESVIWVHEGGGVAPEYIVQRIWDSRPAAYPDSTVGSIRISGPGSWRNSDGEDNSEPQLIWMTCMPTDTEVWFEITVCHDIWAEYDFFGNAHKVVYDYNAPRLASALKSIEEELGVEIEEGDPTFYASPKKYGVVSHPGEAPGRGFDSSSLL